jgi:hypothetical protein
MSQNDFNLANQGFPSMRSDINSALQALASNSSGDTAPATTYAYQFWYETDTNILKMRNAADSAWINIFTFDQANNNWSADAKNLTRDGSQVFSRNNILATVSQTSGVPTGGIIERASNTDGEYVRYADGTQICMNYNVGSQSTTTVIGTLFRATNATTWTFPAAFAVSPVVSGNADDNLARWISFDPPSTTSVAYRQINAVTGTSVRSRVMAVGRWFTP